MSAQEFKAAYDAGRAAWGRGEPTTANPFRREKVHPLDGAPDPHRSLLAGLWLRGWQSNVPKETP